MPEVNTISKEYKSETGNQDWEVDNRAEIGINTKRVTRSTGRLFKRRPK